MSFDDRNELVISYDLSDSSIRPRFYKARYNDEGAAEVFPMREAGKSSRTRRNLGYVFDHFNGSVGERFLHTGLHVFP